MIEHQPPARETEAEAHFHLPTPRECALLILRLVQVREQELQAREEETRRGVSRARISQTTLLTLCRRSRLSETFLTDVQEFLLAAGWCLFRVSATYYAIIKREAVEGWARISSARISEELTAVSRGTYNFERLEPLLLAPDSDAPEGDD